MIKRWLKIYVLVMLPCFIAAQKINIDSLIQKANIAQNDTIKLVRLRTIARIYAELNPDSSYHYAETVISTCPEAEFEIGRRRAIERNWILVSEQG